MLISRSKLLATVKKLVRTIGVEVSFASTASTEHNVLQNVFQHHEIGFVLDVGANSGQYGVLVRGCGFRGPIISFEPLTAAHRRLMARAAADRRWTVAKRVALGADRGHATINVAANSVSSSLLDMTRRHLDAAPHSTYAGTETIDVVTLDECIDQYVGPVKGGLLKIDTQGYEMEVLRGAHGCLTSRIDVVQTELSLVELYAGQPLILDICNFLQQYNFNLHHIIPGLKDPISGRLLQLDGIFSKN